MKQSSLFSSLSRKRYHINLIVLFIICGLLIRCSSALSVFGNESVDYNEPITTIPFEYYDMPMVEVVINSKTYKFLVDTGAPTLISKKIFQDLKIQNGKKAPLGDSQDVIENREFIIIPEMTLGSLSYKNIGAVVTDFDGSFEIDCIGYDGILGANQMSISIWKFDYQKKEIEIAKSIEDFSTSGFKVMEFHPMRPQMTPLVNGIIDGQRTEYTYDTGYSGGLTTLLNSESPNSYPHITKYGKSSAGIYGVGKIEERAIFKVDTLNLGGISLNNVVIDNDVSGLIGNQLIDNYISIIDWKTQKIYWKEVSENDLVSEKTFGFGYRLNTMKAIVANRIKEIDLPFEVGDTILSINETNFENLNRETACALTNFKIEDKLQEMQLRYLKNGEVQSIVLKKQALLND
ncbi:Aspartyl protease [Nonlabens sp. Hel1_33_55]|uniref:retropepsin-like aspartic protease n=1 Tax=Nonlabens sp. Hel1_33_55 TaxID=1336802 RepID=UPI000875AA43|nr:retropepsin-like aspartic protease [Nonlabens sp. Hel1_33_55]SCY15131.1 Aspartyl protease [Nonlabens sp. Hel1_33_55]